MVTKTKLTKSPARRARELTLKREQRYIAYLDILGFTAMLARPDFEQDVTSIARALEERIVLDNRTFPQLRYLAASDTIVIAAEAGEGQLLCRKISQVQNALLSIGFATRGGIVFGDVLTHQGERGWNIFGTTFVNTYLAEKHLAIYPRVVIDNSCVQKLKADIRGTTARKMATYIQRDTDGIYYVNQFSVDVIWRHSRINNRLVAARHHDHFRAIVDRELKATKENPRANMKWRWLDVELYEQLEKKEDA